MVLVPIGSSVVDITVDGVTLVAGDEINDDKSYNLNTDYNARIRVNGSQEYYNGSHDKDTDYDVSISASGGVTTENMRIDLWGGGGYDFEELHVRVPNMILDNWSVDSVSVNVDNKNNRYGGRAGLAIDVNGTQVWSQTTHLSPGEDSGFSASPNITGSKGDSIYIYNIKSNHEEHFSPVWREGTHIDFSGEVGTSPSISVDGVNEY